MKFKFSRRVIAVLTVVLIAVIWTIIVTVERLDPEDRTESGVGESGKSSISKRRSGIGERSTRIPIEDKFKLVAGDPESVLSLAQELIKTHRFRDSRTFELLLESTEGFTPNDYAALLKMWPTEVELDFDGNVIKIPPPLDLVTGIWEQGFSDLDSTLQNRISLEVLKNMKKSSTVRLLWIDHMATHASNVTAKALEEIVGTGLSQQELLTLGSGLSLGLRQMSFEKMVDRTNEYLEELNNPIIVNSLVQDIIFREKESPESLKYVSDWLVAEENDALQSSDMSFIQTSFEQNQVELARRHVQLLKENEDRKDRAVKAADYFEKYFRQKFPETSEN